MWTLHVLLLLGLYGNSVSAARGWKQFTDKQKVVAKNGKKFTCAYKLQYKGSIVNKKRSVVNCQPNIAAPSVTVTFVIDKKNFKVKHAIRKGKDSILSVSVTNYEAPTTTKKPTTSPTTTIKPTIQVATTTYGSPSPGGGEGGQAGSTGPTGSSGGPGLPTGGVDGMECSCSVPFLPANKSSNQATRRSIMSHLLAKSRGGGVLSSSGEEGAAPQGAPKLLKNLVTIALVFGRSMMNSMAGAPQPEARAHRLPRATQQKQVEQRQLPGLGNLIEGGSNQVVEQLINDWISGGGLEDVLVNYLSGEGGKQLIANLFTNKTMEALGEAMAEQMEEMDMEDLWSSLGSSLGESMAEIEQILEQSAQEGELESLEMDMKCSCKPAPASHTTAPPTQP